MPWQIRSIMQSGSVCRTGALGLIFEETLLKSRTPKVSPMKKICHIKTFEINIEAMADKFSKLNDHNKSYHIYLGVTPHTVDPLLHGGPRHPAILGSSKFNVCRYP